MANIVPTFDYAVPDGVTITVNIAEIDAFIKGTIEITGGTGIKASLLER